MSTHGIARISGLRSEEEKRQEQEKIKKYRDLEEQILSQTSTGTYSYTPELFQLTTKVLKQNPEYFTIWNVRRCLLTSGLLSSSSPGSSRSTGSSATSNSATFTHSSAALSPSHSTETRPSQESPTPTRAGQSGTTAKRAETDDDSLEARAAAAENDLNVLQSELVFMVPLLMDYPKCYWMWNYRRWILDLAIERLDVAMARRVWEEELGLDTKMLARDRRNYHAWAYRRYLILRLESAELGGKSMVEEEFAYTKKMILGDLSNFSAWHNRSKLIPRLLEERRVTDDERLLFFKDEMSLIKEAINVGAEDQSLWFYYQFLMTNLTDDVGQKSMVAALSRADKAQYTTEEIKWIEELLDEFNDEVKALKWIYEALVERTLALPRLQNRELLPPEKERLRLALVRLRDLDPMRKGRWDDLQAEYRL